MGEKETAGDIRSKQCVSFCLSTAQVLLLYDQVKLFVSSIGSFSCLVIKLVSGSLSWSGVTCSFCFVSGMLDNWETNCAVF